MLGTAVEAAAAAQMRALGQMNMNQSAGLGQASLEVVHRHKSFYDARTELRRDLEEYLKDWNIDNKSK